MHQSDTKYLGIQARAFSLTHSDADSSEEKSMGLGLGFQEKSKTGYKLLRVWGDRTSYFTSKSEPTHTQTIKYDRLVPVPYDSG